MWDWRVANSLYSAEYLRPSQIRNTTTPRTTVLRMLYAYGTRFPGYIYVTEVREGMLLYEYQSPHPPSTSS